MPFTPRKLLFKAWNQETRLLMRLNHIECVKGELFRKDHILLQFTGMYDRQAEEIYEMDVLLIGAEKLVVVWDGSLNRWSLQRLPLPGSGRPFMPENAAQSTRICSYFESEKAGEVI